MSKACTRNVRRFEGTGSMPFGVHEASAGPHEVETPLKAVAPGEREHTIKSARGKPPQLIDRFSSAGIDHALSAKRSNETCGRGAGCGRDDVLPALGGELHRHEDQELSDMIGPWLHGDRPSLRLPNRPSRKPSRR
jgi:hypothetical protein